MYSKEELKKLKLEFWESFGAYCAVQPYLRGRRKIWMLYDTKVKGVELKFDANREGAYVILEVNHREEERRLEMFERLTWYREALERDLEQNWAVVAEGIQTILRREGYPKPYEALKALTRTNTHITHEAIAAFIETLDVAESVKEELRALSPSTYTGVFRQ